MSRETHMLQAHGVRLIMRQVDDTRNPLQLDLFSYSQFRVTAEATLSTMPDEFDWDQFRAALPYQPANANWFGTFARSMHRLGYTQVTPMKSARESRKHGWVWTWRRTSTTRHAPGGEAP